MDLKDIHKSKKVQRIIIVLGIFIAILVIFKLGVFAGYHKAKFGARFGDNFNRNFIDPRANGFWKSIPGQNMPGGHGTVGEIVSINLPLMVVAGPDNLEKTVVLTEDVHIREFRSEILTSDLKIGDHIVVLGMPNEEGQIEARLIRLVPDSENLLENKQRP